MVKLPTYPLAPLFTFQEIYIHSTPLFNIVKYTHPSLTSEINFVHEIPNFWVIIFKKNIFWSLWSWVANSSLEVSKGTKCT